MSKSSGRVWPYAIGGAITLVFGFCVATIIVTGKADIQESNAYMTHYQDADANANKLIEARIAFDKACNVVFIDNKLKNENSIVQYKVTDKNGNAINSAKLKVLISRPETHSFDQELKDPKIENGVYTFENVAFAKEGVWNFIAKIDVGDLSRFYNIKADTRYNNSYEF